MIFDLCRDMYNLCYNYLHFATFMTCKSKKKNCGVPWLKVVAMWFTKKSLFLQFSGQQVEFCARHRVLVVATVARRFNWECNFQGASQSDSFDEFYYCSTFTNMSKKSSDGRLTLWLELVNPGSVISKKSALLSCDEFFNMLNLQQ